MPTRCCAAQQAVAATTIRLGRRGTSTSAVHATELHGALITTDGTGDGGPVDNANPSSLRRSTTEDNRRRASRRPEEADVRPRPSRRSSPVQRRSDADDYDSSRRRSFDDSDDRRSSVVHRRSSIVTRTQIPSCKERRNTTPSAMVECYDSDRDEARTLKPSPTYRLKRRVTYQCVSSSQSDGDGDADATL